MGILSDARRCVRVRPPMVLSSNRCFGCRADRHPGGHPPASGTITFLLSVLMLSLAILSFVMLSLFMPNFVMLSLSKHDLVRRMVAASDATLAACGCMLRQAQHDG
ncbi:MAG: hypothetical protein AMXMBFR61_25580 [Fimbriimonadales bacterium]